jgi:hypothetical protein
MRPSRGLGDAEVMARARVRAALLQFLTQCDYAGVLPVVTFCAALWQADGTPESLMLMGPLCILSNEFSVVIADHRVPDVGIARAPHDEFLSALKLL